MSAKLKFFDNSSTDNDKLNLFLSEVQSFKELVLQTDNRSIKNGNKVLENDAIEIKEKFNYISQFLNSLMAETSLLTETLKRQIGSTAKREFFPYMLLTNTGERYYSKPKGYAGDFYTIEMIYQNSPQGVGRLGSLLDECFLNLSAAQAVRNRRGLLSEQIVRTVTETPDMPINIMSMACGPSREVIDAFEKIGNKRNVKVTLLDFDEEALEFCKENIETAQLSSQITLLKENIIYLALGRNTISIEKQNLVYSIGLIDYLNDELVIKFLNYVYGILTPQGRVIVGNFHPRNPSKAFMDYVLDWPLIHRTEEDMDRLFRSSKFACPCTNIYFESEDINLFAECVKSGVV